LVGEARILRAEGELTVAPVKEFTWIALPKPQPEDLNALDVDEVEVEVKTVGGVA
jgi:hypothetical protein